jgi:hypothetical protein
MSPRAGRGSSVNRRRGSAQRQQERLGQPTFRSARSVQTLVSPIDPVISIATSPNRPVAATCFPDECGRIPGHPRQTSARSHLAAHHHRAPRETPSLRPRAPCLRVHRPPHAVVVALDATLSPRACRGMWLDSYGGCRPPPRRVSPPYVLLESSASTTPR